MTGGDSTAPATDDPLKAMQDSLATEPEKKD